MFDEGHPYQAVVMDIMMAAPLGAEKATAEGLDTGLWILNEIRAPLKNSGTPVIVLTNRSLPHISEALNAMEFPAGQIRAQSKVETPAFLLPKVVAATLASRPKTRDRGPRTQNSEGKETKESRNALRGHTPSLPRTCD